jgi:hypothetical protein
MPQVKVTAFRFTDEELELLGVIEGHTGIRSRTEALRKVLKEHVPSEASHLEAKTIPVAAGGGGRVPQAKESKGEEK